MFDSVPKLTAAMRASCPDGADCACAARLDGRLEAGEAEGAILDSHSPRMIMLGGNPGESMPHPGLLIAALVSHLTGQTRTSRLRPMTYAGPEGDMSMSRTEDGGTATESRFDVSSLLDGLDETAGAWPSHTIDDLPPTGGTMRQATARVDETVLV